MEEFNMKFEFDEDELDFKNEIELMNLQRKMQENQFTRNQSIGFNMDALQNLANKDENKQTNICYIGRGCYEKSYNRYTKEIQMGNIITGYIASE